MGFVGVIMSQFLWVEPHYESFFPSSSDIHITCIPNAFPCYLEMSPLVANRSSSYPFLRHEVWGDPGHPKDMYCPDTTGFQIPSSSTIKFHHHKIRRSHVLNKIFNFLSFEIALWKLNEKGILLPKRYCEFRTFRFPSISWIQLFWKLSPWMFCKW